MKTMVVKLEMPIQGWYKYNTDGASKENLVLVHWPFVLGMIRVTLYMHHVDNTSLYAEALAMKEGCTYCVEK